MNNTIIIAEAGVNHNGNLELAKRLVEAAAEAGADYVKFQTFKTDNLVAKTTALADYQKKNLSKETGNQYEMLRKLELTERDHQILIDHCQHNGIKFLSTAFDLDSLKLLNSLHLDYWKIPSGEITNYPFLKKIAQYGGKVIMSTGMSTTDDISRALSVLNRYGTPLKNITLLHCNTEYPTPMADVNLRAIMEMHATFDLNVGYSDHTVGIEVPIAAVALGATIIEKHFTLDRGMNGPDHSASLEPAELKDMVRAIRNIEKALGSGVKVISCSERKNISAARKSIVAARHIAEGEIFNEDNLTTKRPGTGISPMRWDEVIGKRAPHPFKADELIEI